MGVQIDVKSAELEFSHALDQPHDMGEFHGDDTGGLQQPCQATDEVVHVRHVSEHIVADDEVGLSALSHEFISEARAKKIDDGRDSLLLRRLCDGVRRVDTQDRYTVRLQVLQQVAVV